MLNDTQSYEPLRGLQEATAIASPAFAQTGTAVCGHQTTTINRLWNRLNWSRWQALAVVFACATLILLHWMAFSDSAVAASVLRLGRGGLARLANNSIHRFGDVPTSHAQLRDLAVAHELDGINAGCTMMQSEWKCVSSMDGRRGQSYSGSPCQWCCGGPCTTSEHARCEPKEWLLRQSTYIGRSRNGLGEDTCDGSTARLRGPVGGELDRPNLARAPTPTPTSKRDSEVLDGTNGGCHLITTEAKCVASKDGRRGQVYSQSPCHWCCGLPCTSKDDVRCEPKRWLLQQPTYVGRSKNGIGEDTCGAFDSAVTASTTRAMISLPTPTPTATPRPMPSLPPSEYLPSAHPPETTMVPTTLRRTSLRSDEFPPMGLHLGQPHRTQASPSAAVIRSTYTTTHMTYDIRPCPVWATARALQSPTKDNSLFCFQVTQPRGDEISLVGLQFERGASIFGCENFMVFSVSDASVWISRRPACAVKTIPLQSNSANVGNTSAPEQTTNSWLNTGTFLRAWEAIFRDGRFRSHSWTVKVDPDSVFFPERLRYHLRSTPGNPIEDSFYFLNCDQWGGRLFGPLEVFSRKAIEVFATGLSRCRKELRWSGWGEDFFVQKCMDHLAVRHRSDFGMLSDFSGHCTKAAAPACDGGWQVAFHPRKTPSLYSACLAAAKKFEASQTYTKTLADG